MRPRVFAAEDSGVLRPHGRPLAASMRPRVFAAEDQRCPRQSDVRVPGFNEAAGIRRGRLEAIPEIGHRPDPASMRPRVFAAEDVHETDTLTAGRHRRFNEAAGIRRGRHRGFAAGCGH